MLLCTVRNCRVALQREAQRYVCARGHSFDVARSGYVNLLQPNERRSKSPGDSAEVIAARRRLYLECGGEAAALALVKAAALPPHSKILDVGCGDGFWLAAFEGHERHGIDISVPAIEAAAKRYPDCQWVVANADRFIPYEDASFDLVLSITSRLNWPEFRRVVREDGRLLVVLAGEDDLHELRSRLRCSAGVPPAPLEALKAPGAGWKPALHRSRIVSRHLLDPAALRDVMLSAYRGLRETPNEPTKVTFSRDLLLFAPEPRDTPQDSSA